MKWPREAIGRLAVTVTKGTTPTTLGYRFASAGIPFVRVQNLFDGKVDTSRDPLFIDQQTHKALERSQIQQGDLLISIAGTIGRSAIVDVDTPLNCNQAVAIVRLNVDVDARYVLRWLGSSDAMRQIGSKGVTGTIANLSLAQIRSLNVPLPPLAEQKRIAGILDAADALRAKRRASLAQLDTLLQSTFLDMFGDPVTNPMGWDVVPFHRIGRFVSGATPSKERDDFWGGSIPWVSPKDMKRDFIDSSLDTISEVALKETNIKLVARNHMLIVVRGMILAHSFPAALNTRPVTINQDMKAIKPDERFLPLYLLSCMKAQKRGILAMISEAGHGTKKFDQKSMEATRVPLPPLDIQRRFATIVESVERQKTRQRAHLAELNALFASLQHRAFNGEL